MNTFSERMLDLYIKEVVKSDEEQKLLRHAQTVFLSSVQKKRGIIHLQEMRDKQRSIAPAKFEKR